MRKNNGVTRQLTCANKVGNGAQPELVEEYVTHDADDAGNGKPANLVLLKKKMYQSIQRRCFTYINNITHNIKQHKGYGEQKNGAKSTGEHHQGSSIALGH